MRGVGVHGIELRINANLHVWSGFVPGICALLGASRVHEDITPQMKNTSNANHVLNLDPVFPAVKYFRIHWRHYP